MENSPGGGEQLYSEHSTSKGELSFSKIKTFSLQTYCFCQNEFFLLGALGKLQSARVWGPKTPACCNPKPLAVTKTCLQVENFRSRAFRVVLFGCMFVCLFGAKGFPPPLPRTRERESALHLGCWPQNTCNPQFVCPQRLEARKAVRKLKEYPVPAFTLNAKPRIVRWGTTKRSISITVVFMWAEWISAFLFLFSRPVVSDPLRPHGLQHARLPCPSLSPRACSNSCPLSR